MSSRRTNKKPGGGDLNVRLVHDDDSLGLDHSPLPDTSAASAAAAISSSASIPSAVVPSSSTSAAGPSSSLSASPTPLISVFSHHSLAKTLGSGGGGHSSSSSSASYNQPHASSLASGQRDMELVELNVNNNRHGDSSSAEPDDFHDGHAHPLSSSAASSSSNGVRQWPSVLRDGWRVYLLRSFSEVFLSTKMNLLLFAVPIAIICKLANLGDGPVFVFSLIGLCPLAERISFVTDEMALYTNDTVGGLLSATMGNATELIVSFFALRKGLLRIVQLSLLGSIFSNMLLVQGTAFLVGGVRFSQQKFSQQAARTNISLLALACMALFFPMVLIASNTVSATNADGTPVTIPVSTGGTNNTTSVTLPELEGITTSNSLKLSRFTSVLMLLTYALLIFYQLKTHAHLFESREEGPEEEEIVQEDGTTRMVAVEQEPPVLGGWGSIVWAVVVTLFISLLSEFIVSTIDGAASALGIPVLFSATILLPIVGNAAEHASAIIFAKRDKMDIALGISVGSSTQIALFVIPLMVILGWMGGESMSLDFQVFESVSLFLTIMLSSFVLSTGKSDYLYGVMMIVAYAIISAAFWWQKQPADLK